MFSLVTDQKASQMFKPNDTSGDGVHLVSLASFINETTMCIIFWVMVTAQGEVPKGLVQCQCGDSSLQASD